MKPTQEQGVIIEAKGSFGVSAGPGGGKSATARMKCEQLKGSEVGVFSFSSALAKEAEEKIPWVFASTAHRYGNFVCRSNNIKIKVGRYNPNKNRKLFDGTRWNLNFDHPDPDKRNVARAAGELISKLKLTLTDPEDSQAVSDLATRFGISSINDDIIEAMPQMLIADVELATSGIASNFDDMVFLPVYLGLNGKKFDYVIVDEAQDLSNCVRSLLLGARDMLSFSGGTIGIYDRKQAIMQFAGANHHSSDLFLKAVGGKELQLTTCFRCPVSHIELANKLFPDDLIYPRDGAPDGEIDTMELDTLIAEIESNPELQRNTIVICRRKAPLVGPCLQLLRRGFKASISGKDIEADLNELAENIASKSKTMNEFEVGLTAWQEKERERLIARKVSEQYLELVDDKVSAIRAIAEDSSSPFEITGKINYLFKESKPENSIIFMTMHKSKGLESDNVIILESDKMRIVKETSSAEDCEAERCLEYVAKTRGKRRLIMVPSRKK